MFDEGISLISLCSSMNSWLTPTVLFVLLNLMIGTIAFTSAISHKTTSHEQHHQQFQPQHQQHIHHFQQQQQQQQQQHQFQQPQLITRSSSVLQRLKSINFNNLYTTFYSHPPPAHFHQPEPEPEPQPEPQQTKTTTTEEYNVNGSDDDNDNPSMEEIYNRIKQSNLVSHYNRQNSDTKPSGGELPVKLPQKMKKSASHKSAFNHFHLQPSQFDDDDNKNNVGVNGKYVETVEEEEEERESVIHAKNKEDEGGGGGGVDAQADDFINRFKKKWQLERIHSIVRYKEMISRTSAQ